MEVKIKIIAIIKIKESNQNFTERKLRNSNNSKLIRIAKDFGIMKKAIRAIAIVLARAANAKKWF